MSSNGTLDDIDISAKSLIKNTPTELVRANKTNMERNSHIAYLKGFYLRNLLVAAAKSLKICGAEYFSNDDHDLLIKFLRHVDDNIHNTYSKILSRMRVYKVLGLCIPVAGWVWLYKNRRNFSNGNTNPISMLVAKEKLRQEGVDTDDILQKFVYDCPLKGLSGFSEKDFSEKFGMDFV